MAMDPPDPNSWCFQATYYPSGIKMHNWICLTTFIIAFTSNYFTFCPWRREEERQRNHMASLSERKPKTNRFFIQVHVMPCHWKALHTQHNVANCPPMTWLHIFSHMPLQYTTDLWYEASSMSTTSNNRATPRACQKPVSKEPFWTIFNGKHKYRIATNTIKLFATFQQIMLIVWPGAMLYIL